MASFISNFRRHKSAHIICIFIYCTYLSVYCQVDDTVCIDFGSDQTMTMNGWNNLTLQRTGSISDLINISGINTGIAVAVTDQFNG